MNRRQKEKWRKHTGVIPNFKAGDKMSWSLNRKADQYYKHARHLNR